MRILIIPILLLTSFCVTGQTVTKDDFEKVVKPLTERVKKLQAENNKLKLEIGILYTKLSATNLSIDSLKNQSVINIAAIGETRKELGSKILTTERNADQKITAVDKLLSKNSLYGIIAVLLAILVSAFLYGLVRKRQITDRSDFLEQLSNTKSSIEKGLVKEFCRQTELMDSQLHMLSQQKPSLQLKTTAEQDHSLALKVASEINLIERNINLMDSQTKGLKQLRSSIGKLKDNLIANGYEMPQLLGKHFHQGMKVIVASSIPDESLEKGSEIITKILIPQVNFNDKMIQTAQIEVSVGS